jgi:5-methylcytosine-specific restriction endonuclease McrA
VSRGDPRYTSHRYRQARKAFLEAVPAWCQAEVCNARHRAVNLAARGRWGPSIDHVNPTSLNGADFWDMRHWRLVHMSCNASRGNGVTTGWGSRQNGTPQTGEHTQRCACGNQRRIPSSVCWGCGDPRPIG